MKLMWCWRCRMNLPMLNEAEFAVVKDLYSKAFRANGEAVKERFAPLLAEYEKMTGFAETVPAAIMHHRIADYGAPCEFCGKPLRTPKAAFCAACGKYPEAQLVR